MLFWNSGWLSKGALIHVFFYSTKNRPNERTIDFRDVGVGCISGNR